MPSPITVTLGTNTFTLNTGDLTADAIAKFPQGVLTLASDALNAAFGNPISSLSSDTLEASLSAGTSLNWSFGNITLQFSPSIQGTVAIRKAGEVFRFAEAEKDDDPDKRQIVTVPAGSAYVSISLSVSIGVAAGGGFSNGTLGVKGSAQLTDTFLLANHVRVAASDTVGAALQAAFGRFVLPFKHSAYRDIQDGDFLEYQFYGKLNVALTTTLGFGGVLFGGISGGDLRRTFSSPVGSVTAQAKPEFNLGAEFAIGYQHEDAFRIVLSGLSDRSRLFLFKIDDSRLSAGLTLSASVSANASISLEANVDALIGQATAKLFDKVPDAQLKQKLIDAFTARVKSASSEVDKYVQEAEQKINDQLKKLDKLKVSAGIAFERISEHATLLSIDFDRTAQADAYALALGGDMAGVLTKPGASLAPGSYTRSEIRKTTALSFQLFEAFNATSFETYFQKSQLIYAGNGVFQLRFSTGLSAGSNVFGHSKAVEFYFEITASATAKGTISDQDINLHINTTDQNNQEASSRTAAMLHMALRNTLYDGLDNVLRQAVANHPKVTVAVTLVLAPSAYKRLHFSPFVGDHPTSDQTADALNYAAFVNAVDLIYAGGGFGKQGFPDQVDKYKNWAHYNITAIDQETSTKPPNRRQIGNANTQSVWPQDSTNFPAVNADLGTRSMLRTFMVAAQQFMNFCEDLPLLSSNLDAATTQQMLKRVVTEADDLVKDANGAFPLFFTKPFAAALLAQSGAVVQTVQAPAAGDSISDAFTVKIELT